MSQLQSASGNHAGSLLSLLQVQTTQPQMVPKNAMVSEARQVSAGKRAELRHQLLLRSKQPRTELSPDWDQMIVVLNELLGKVGPGKQLPPAEQSSRRLGSGWLAESGFDQLRIDDFVLNNSFPGKPSPGGRAVDVAQKVVQAFMSAFKEFADESGVVDASKLIAIGKSSKFEDAAHMAGYLQLVDTSTITNFSDKLAFFTNCFNALVMHGWVRRRPRLSSYGETHWMEVNHFFKSIRYGIGLDIFSALELEHSVLRAYSSRPKGMGPVDAPKFDSDEPRIVHRLNHKFVAVGFALCHGCVSSPSVQEISTSQPEHQINMSAIQFCQQHVEVVNQPNGSRQVLTPAYFDWYQQDFSTHAHSSSKAAVDIIGWIGTQLPPNSPAFSALIKPLEKSGGHNKVELKFKPFQWEFTYRFPPEIPQPGHTQVEPSQGESL